MSVYAPNHNNLYFFDAVSQNLSDFAMDKVVVGDFNVVLDVKLDRHASTHNHPKSATSLKRFIEDYSLRDVWRDRNPEKIRFSWQRHESNQASRIDFALLSPGFVNKCELVDYFQGIETDHSAVILSIKDIKQERGASYWKLNTLNLQKQGFVSETKREILNSINVTADYDPTQRWEKLKSRVTQSMKNSSRKIASDKNLIIAQLSEVINGYEESFPLNKEDQKIYLDTVDDLNKLLYERTAGLIFRSKARWAADGEKSSKYFFNLERTRANSKACQVLLKEDGTLLENIPDILDEQRRYYSELYKNDEEICFTLQNNTTQMLNNEQYNLLNIPISINEIRTAIKSLPNGKSPGPDGLPVEFYKTFIDELAGVLFDHFSHVFQTGKMNKSAMEGVLNLIPKSNKDSRVLKNLRPITLLNVDYKIIEKLIALRLQSVLPSIIHSDQTGFMAGRRMAINIRRILDIMNHCENKDIPAFILSIDFMKAFDRCEVQSILESLKFFNFPTLIIEWVNILYKDFKVKVQNFGHFSKDIPIRRSVHQGGCASAFLFDILVEVMAIQFRENLTNSIVIRGEKHDLGQYADDTAIFSLFEENALQKIVDELEAFHRQSGLLVNYDKTSVYRIGSLKDSNAQLYTSKPLAWENEGIPTLGVWVTHQKNLLDMNYTPVYMKMKAVLNSWSKRSLSLIGKILIVNSLIMSLFVHKMTVLPNLPRKLIQKINNDIMSFIWNGKRAKIPLKILQLPKDKGGLGLINLCKKEMSLKVSWIQLLESDLRYASIAYGLFSPLLQDDLFRCNLSPDDIRHVTFPETPPFWCDVLRAWCTINFNSENATDPSSMYIWYNSLLKVDGKPFLWKKCYQKGLKHIHQLFEDGRFIDVEMAERVFGLTVLQFNTLKSVIPSHWKEQIQHVHDLNGGYLYDRWLGEQGIVRKAYAALSDRIDIGLHLKKKWSSELDVDQDLLSDQAKNMYITTNSTKLRSFYYRCLNKALILNSHLFRWGLIDNNLCSFCSESKETNTHIFWECSCVQELWCSIAEWVESIGGEMILSRTNVIVNKFAIVPSSFENTVGIAIKQYIYKQRCLGKRLFCREAISMLELLKNVEKFNAIRLNQLHKHTTKWSVHLD